MHDLPPSEARRRVLTDHARLREQMSRLRILAEDSELDVLRRAARTFFAQLGAHMTMEDEILAPVLASIDAWGVERSARIARDHAAQRAWVASYDAFLARCVSRRLARDRILTFLAELEDDMAIEEARDLSEELFSDIGPAPDLGGHID